jgi:hypothetical protein
MCRLVAIVFTQHLANGDLSRLGWAVAAVYVIGGVFCVRAGMVVQQPGPRNSSKQVPWWALAGVLLFLGINKGIDVQTLLIHLGRVASQTGGWSQYQRTVQVAFVVLFTLAALVAGVACLAKWRWFFKEQPMVCAGAALLCLFVVVRDATINHVDERLHLNFHDDHWGWVLEIFATTCFAWSAARVKAQ